MPDVVDLIRAKRDGQVLADGEIRWLIDAYTSGEIADEQMSALLMAIYFRGLDPAELRSWTASMIDSGERLDLSAVPAPTVDKHSTGGVGDKVSLSLAPLVAACGVPVPMMSGRGLGHTGGTLDKLESIPGFAAELRSAERSVLATARHLHDRRRPDTDSPPPTTHCTRCATSPPPSSRSRSSPARSCRRRLAEGTDALVLDVKVGPGAFMKDHGDATTSWRRPWWPSETEHNVQTTALLTTMDTPLGRAVGNAVEVEESVATLAGGGPPDLAEVILALWRRRMLALARRCR